LVESDVAEDDEVASTAGVDGEESVAGVDVEDPKTVGGGFSIKAPFGSTA
jgi:hypothetical protein